ncbi:MAG: hypothetical protein HY777_15625 [Betaproteobacteria bacterium]|nr:hypothetical protein [Betaproteobacteria bacterium]
MKKMLVVALFAVAGVAQAGEYVCKVYCNSGETYVTVNADSSAGAAAKVDQRGHEICKSDNKGNATSKTMRPEQCSRK